MARLPYRSREELPQEKRHLYDEIAQKRTFIARPFLALLNRPEAAAKVAAVGEFVRFYSVLDPELTEVATLAAARENDSQYEWTRHEALALKAGVKPEVIDLIRHRKPLGQLPSRERTVVAYARELLRDKRVSDRTYRTAIDLLGTDGTIDLTVLVSFYTMLAHILAAFEVELEEHLEPLLPL